MDTKKILSAIVAGTMALSAMSFTAMAEGEQSIEPTKLVDVTKDETWEGAKYEFNEKYNDVHNEGYAIRVNNNVTLTLVDCSVTATDIVLNNGLFYLGENAKVILKDSNVTVENLNGGPGAKPKVFGHEGGAVPSVVLNDSEVNISDSNAIGFFNVVLEATGSTITFEKLGDRVMRNVSGTITNSTLTVDKAEALIKNDNGIGYFTFAGNSTVSVYNMDAPNDVIVDDDTNTTVYVYSSVDVNNINSDEYILIDDEAPELPTATVTEVENEDLTFALNFLADEATEEQLAYYGDWYADFVLTVNKDVTFNANGGADGYLSGQYDEWSENWVNVPFSDVTLKAGESLKIMEYAAGMLGEPGLRYTYREVYEVVKDFDCGVFFTEEFLAANPDLMVTLELRMYNPKDESESYVIGDTYVFTIGQPTYVNTYYGKFTGTGNKSETVATAIKTTFKAGASDIDSITWTYEDMTTTFDKTTIASGSTVVFGVIIDGIYMDTVPEGLTVTW